ncbi:MAG: MFS transporter [Pseudomonadota bacterium]
MRDLLRRARFPTRREDWRRLGAIFSLQVAHDLPNALTATMAPTLFVKSLGMPLEYLGLFFLPFAVTALKWVWAPIVDNRWSPRLGRRRSWLLPCTVFVSLVYVAIAAVPPSLETLWIIIALLMVKQVFYSTQEIAADAYVVENLSESERGLGASVVWLGKEFGQIIGFAGLLFVADRFGWAPAFLTAALLFAVFNAPALLRREPAPPSAAQEKAASGDGARISAFFGRRVNWHVLAIVFAVAFAVQMPVAVIGPFLGSKGLSLSEIGVTLGLAASFGAMISLGVSSVAITRIGPKRMAIAMLFIGPLAAPGFLWLAQAEAVSIGVVIAIVFWATICTAPLRMVLYAARIGWTSKDQVGTDFTIQQSTWFLGFAATGAASGALAAQIGWTGFFVVNLALTTAAVLWFVMAFDGIQKHFSPKD